MFKMFPICSAAFHILLYLSIGDFGLPSRALLSAPRGGHVGRPVAEEVQVSRDSHCHRLRAAWLLRTGERELDVVFTALQINHSSMEVLFNFNHHDSCSVGRLSWLLPRDDYFVHPPLYQLEWTKCCSRLYRGRRVALIIILLASKTFYVSCSGPRKLRESNGEGEERTREEQRLPGDLPRVPALGGPLDTVRFPEQKRSCYLRGQSVLHIKRASRAQNHSEFLL